MSVVLKSVRVTFPLDAIEYAVTYAHTEDPASPGTKKMSATVERMARAGLERVLKGLCNDVGRVQWGVLFVAAVACAVFAALFRDEGNPYLNWGARVTWLALCVAPALVPRARLL